MCVCGMWHSVATCNPSLNPIKFEMIRSGPEEDQNDDVRCRDTASICDKPGSCSNSELTRKGRRHQPWPASKAGTRDQ